MGTSNNFAWPHFVKTLRAVSEMTMGTVPGLRTSKNAKTDG